MFRTRQRDKADRLERGEVNTRHGCLLFSRRSSGAASHPLCPLCVVALLFDPACDLAFTPSTHSGTELEFPGKIWTAAPSPNGDTRDAEQ